MEYEKKGALSEHEKGGGHKKGAEHEHQTGAHHPHIHIHSHGSGHTMHVMHPDGAHEMHHFGPGDTDGMKEVMDQHMGGGSGDMMAQGGGAPAPGAAGGAPEPEEQAA